MRSERTMVRKQLDVGTGKNDIPESLLDAADVVDVPVLFGHIFLADRNTGPGDTHLGDAINVVLIKVDLESAEVTFRPLRQAPFLDDLLGLVELDKFSVYIAIEDRELSTDLGAVKLTRCATGESGDPLRISEGGIHLLSGGPELIRDSDCGGVDSDLIGGGGRRLRSRASTLGSLGIGGWCSETAGRVNARSMLDVLSVLGDQSGSKLAKLLSDLGNKLRTNEVLHRLLGGGIRVILDLKLQQELLLTPRTTNPAVVRYGRRDTYNILILLRVVGNLRNSNGATN
jgi:hypothetical protein